MPNQNEVKVCYPSYENIPHDIVNCAIKLSTWFMQQGIAEWQLMGVASRPNPAACAAIEKPIDLDLEYQAAWVKQEKQWQELREWCTRNSDSIRERTHFMDFAAGWNAAMRVKQDIKQTTTSSVTGDVDKLANELNSTLAAIHYDKCDNGGSGSSSIDQLFLAAIKSTLNQATEKLRMELEKAKSLEGYRELGRQIADALDERDAARAQLAAIESSKANGGRK